MGLRWLAVAMAMAMALALAMPHAEAATDCPTILATLAGCYGFLSNVSSIPDNRTCCQPLVLVLSSPDSFQCICAQAGSLGDNAKSALLIPAACKLAINVTEANCTSTTTPSPSSGNSTSPGGGGSGGPFSSSPYLPIVAAALMGATALLLL